MDSKIAGLVVMVLAVLCCALPLLIAAGVLGGLTAWFASWWVAAAVVGIVVIAAALLTWRRTVGRTSSACRDGGDACETEDRMSGRRTDDISQAVDSSSGSPEPHDPARTAQTGKVRHGDRR